MLHSSRLPVLLFSSFIFFISCTPGDDDPDPGTPVCRVSKSYAYDSGIPYDSASYTYTNGQLTKVENEDYSITLQYTGDKITRRNFYTPGSTTLEGYELITYNTNGTINKISRFSNSTEDERFEFTYTGDKLTKSAIWYDYGAGLMKEEEVSYVYTGGNVTKIYDEDITNPGVHMDSLVLTHDTQPNYFRKQSSQFLLSDPFFLDFEGAALSLIISENNVIKVHDPAYPADDVHFTYTTDSQGNLATFSEDGDLIFRYVYNCQ